MIDYQITDVVDHSVMKLDVFDLISNMPSTEIETRGYFGKHKSVISNSNWDDYTEIKSEIWPFFLTPNDQKKYFDSIENKFPDRRWDNWVVEPSWFNQ